MLRTGISAVITNPKSFIAQAQDLQKFEQNSSRADGQLLCLRAKSWRIKIPVGCQHPRLTSISLFHQQWLRPNWQHWQRGQRRQRLMNDGRHQSGFKECLICQGFNQNGLFPMNLLILRGFSIMLLTAKYSLPRSQGPKILDNSACTS